MSKHLPKGTPYDDAFRTLFMKGGNLVIPLLNEMFPSDTPIRRDAQVLNLSNELYLDGADGEQKKLVTDSYLHVDGKTYHVECQSYDDGDMVVRMVRYDMGIAMQEYVQDGDTVHIRLPSSGVLYLRKTAATPTRLHVHLQTPGGTVQYDIPTLRLADYGLETLKGKKLAFLIPFYLFNLENRFAAYERGNESARAQVAEAMENVLEYLNAAYKSQDCDIAQYLLLADMLGKVTDHLTARYEQVRKELDGIMGGKILEFKGERLLKEGLEKGQKQGRIIELAELARDGILPLQQAEALAGKKYGISAESFQKLVHSSEEEQMEG